MPAVAKLESTSDIEDLEEIECSGGKFGCGIPPNIERALASREPKKPIPQEPPVVALDPPARRMPAVARMISNYNEFLDAVRERVDFMGMTRLELDHLTGMQSGYMGKLLGPRQNRRFGEVSFDATLPAIGCRLVLVEDPELTAKIMARMMPRQRPIRVVNPEGSL
jgi:hypothetical protein